MSTYFRVTIAFLLLWAFSMVGCQNSPGGVLSPKSDMYVIGQTPQTIMANVTSGSTAQVTAPPLKIYFNITNGVSVFLDTYVVRYFDRTGKVLNSGAFDYAGTLNQQINAGEIGGAKQTTASVRGATISDYGTAGGDGPAVSEPAAPSSVGWTQIEIVSWPMLNFILSGTTAQVDDVAPVVAKVALHGRDINGNDINVTTQVTISNSYSQSTAAAQ